jgi:Transglutaminase-like superfamily
LPRQQQPCHRLNQQWAVAIIDLREPVQPVPDRAQWRHASPHDDVRLAETVGWVVTHAARHVPFKAVCLPQAMADKIMLKRRGVNSVLHFGAKMGQGRLIAAHARLDAAGVEVTGYPVAKTFAEIVCFV